MEKTTDLDWRRIDHNAGLKPGVLPERIQVPQTFADQAEKGL